MSLNALLNVVDGVVCDFFFVCLQSLSLSVLVSTNCIALFIEKELVFALVVTLRLDFFELALRDR